MKIFVKDEEIEIEENATGFLLAQKLHLTAPDKAIAIKINGVSKDLSQKLKKEDKVEFLDFNSEEGKKIFWHTSAHVLAQAVKRLYPNSNPTIGPAIENGFYYDFANLNISEKELPLIEKEMKKIISQNLRPQKEILENKEVAIKSFEKNPFKQEMIKDIVGEITGYRQGEFFDLCKGPHLYNIGKIKAFKLLKTSGAYWRADQKNEMLTRIYGISFPDKKMLNEYLTILEEAKKRDHKILGKQLDLFSFKEFASGMVFLHPKGMYIWNTILQFLQEKLEEFHYQEIKTPILMNQDLWEKSGHWEYYHEHMYISEIENKKYAIKPMNCPGCMLYYKTHVHSYRELPLRISEIGHVHRHELSGSLNGLFRVRSFHQDDAHIFMEKKDVTNEILNILDLLDKVYMSFGLSYKLELSTKPEKSIGSQEDWQETTSYLKQALEKWGHSYKINEGEGAFYGPKIDIHIKDALGRYWQCATIQVDMSLPDRFDLKYIDNEGNYKRPIMIHRTILGSIERFLAVLIEHFAGKFPLWLSPLSTVIIPIADRHIEFCQKLLEKLKKNKITCAIDKSHESVSKKIRNAQILKTNYMITIGDKEVQKEKISIRTRNANILHDINIDDFIKKIVKEKVEKALISPYS